MAVSDLLGELSSESDLDDLRSETKRTLNGGTARIVAANPERKTIS